jgi:hypothetical protein
MAHFLQVTPNASNSAPARVRQSGLESNAKTVCTVLAIGTRFAMPHLTTRNPSYRKHKASGQAIVTIDGQDVY